MHVILDTNKYLIPPNYMKHDACISKVNKPVGLVEPKARQEVAWCGIPKGGVSKGSTTKVEEGRYKYSHSRCLLHRLTFWGWGPQCVLYLDED